MKYDNIVKGTFIERPNRFIAYVEIDNSIEIVHVKNTGRCKELLVPNATVYLQKSNNPNRKTAYDLIAVEKLPSSGCKKIRLINMDSQVPNYVAKEWILNQPKLFPTILNLKQEFSFGKSRFDLLVEYLDSNSAHHKLIVEVKGCTLEENGVALFPDAPTSRGVKHLRHLSEIAQGGEFETMVLFVIQMDDISYFSPNKKNDPDFALALKEASKNGVQILAIDTDVTPTSISPKSLIKVLLD